MKTDRSRFDAEQRRAIEELSGRNIIVSASAGSGKTSVLVARILKRCIDDRVPVRRILALTFTKAAAEEMKNRLAKELHKLYEQVRHDGDPDDAAYIEQQIIDLVSADITTIDSWCMTVIQKYYNTIGLDPAMIQNIISESIDALYELDAFYDAVKALYRKDPTQASAFFEYMSPRSIDYEDSVFRYYIHPINTYAASLCDPDAWYQQVRATYAEASSLADYPAPVRDGWYAWILQLCETIRDNALICNGAKRTKAFTDEEADLLVNTAQDAYICAKKQDYEGLRACIPSFVKARTPASRDAVTKQAARRYNEALDSLLQNLYSEEVLTVDSAAHARIFATLLDLAEDTRDRYQAYKRKNTAMTFADMERFTLDILSETRPVASILRDAYDEILVDEFQDTSFLQNEIITRISTGSNLFRVGDIKQSIYRFRQARPSLMQSLLEKAEADSTHDVHIALHHNYRSVRPIVNFANTLFGRLMSVDGLRYPFTDSDLSRIGENEACQKRQGSSREPVTCLYIPYNSEDKMSASQQRTAMSAAIATAILKKHQAGAPWKSMAVLVRGRNQKLALKRIFDLYDIPYDLDAREGFYQSDLCQLILSVAKYMRNPYDEISLMAILTSPMYELSDQTIAEAVLDVRSAVKEMKRTEQPCTIGNVRSYLHMPPQEAFENMTAGSDLRSAMLVFWPHIQKFCDRLKDTVLADGIQAMLARWINMTCGPSENAAAPDILYDRLSAQSRANFNYLFDTFTDVRFNDLDSFIRLIEESTDEQSSEAVSVGKDDDVVQVTTIHGSKGLQYPTVFLFGTGSSSHPRHSGVTIDDELGFAIPDMDTDYRVKLPTIPSILIAENDDKEEMEEFIRLFYVAVTRAASRLYLVECLEKDDIPFTDSLTMDDLKAYKGGTLGLTLRAMRHEGEFDLDPETGFPLFMMEEAEIMDPPQKTMHIAPVHFPRAAKQTSLLPEMITPSSLERPRMQKDTVNVLPPLAFGKNRGTAYGTMMHALAEALPDDIAWDGDLIRKEAVKLGYDAADVYDSSITALQNFQNSDLYKACAGMRIYKEYPFYSEAFGRMNGSIDFAAIGDTKIILIDFKTDNKTPDAIREDYSGQLNAYRRILQTAYPDKQVEAYAYSFHNHCAIIIPEE